MEISSLEEIHKRSAYQGVQESRRPEWAGIDQDPARRPGRLRVTDPKPLPNSVYPPEQQPGEPAVPKHGRPNKPMVPVFGTSTPLKGLSGMVRKLAYSLPDHKPEHWLLMMLGDRVESMGYRMKEIAPIAVPALGLFLWLRSR